MQIQISKNIDQIKEKINKACEKSGRKTTEVKLLAVSKNVNMDRIKEAYQTGHKMFGENRVQELLQKIPVLPQDIEWHLIGTLQRNKVKYIVDKVTLIHSVHSVLLAREISKYALKMGKDSAILLQVNIAEEDAKHGFLEEELWKDLKDIKDLPGIKIKGLMTMAPFTENPEEVRLVFRRLSQLAKRIQQAYPHLEMKELSMGMSNDYQVAVEEGATIIRIGSDIFGRRNP